MSANLKPALTPLSSASDHRPTSHPLRHEYLTGYTLDDVYGQTPAVLSSGQHDDRFYANLYQTLAKGEDFRATFVNKRRDGSIFHAEQSISPISDEKGCITHYISVSKDITTRVNKEQALVYAATHDKLTGLYNRRHGEKLLNEAYLYAQAQQEPLSLLVCDIDHFKQINDRFGHPAGDRALHNVATHLLHGVRSRDPVIRWGGEEFIIVLSQCAAAPAFELAERLRHRLQNYRDAEVGSLTLSLGLATLKTNETLEQLIARADAAAYQAKHQGRNRTVVASDNHLMASG